MVYVLRDDIELGALGILRPGTILTLTQVEFLVGECDTATFELCRNEEQAYHVSMSLKGE